MHLHVSGACYFQDEAMTRSVTKETLNPNVAESISLLLGHVDSPEFVQPVDQILTVALRKLL